MHQEYSDFVNPYARSDYLTELESEIKKEHSDLLRMLDAKRPIHRIIYRMNPTGSFYNFSFKHTGNYILKSINLIIKFRDPMRVGFNLKDILLDMYFEMYGKETKFSNTETLWSSRLYNRYLRTWLESIDTISHTESIWKINIFDFTHVIIHSKYLDETNFLRMFPQKSDIISLGTADFFLETLMEPTDETNSPQIKYLRPKNSDSHVITKQVYKSWITNSGFCIGLFLCFEPISTKSTNELDPDYIPDLISIKITLDSTINIYESDSIVIFETPEFKYAVLIFDPSLRSKENIKDILDGYVYDSKKIHGLNIISSDDHPVNINMIEQELDETSDTGLELVFDPEYNYSSWFKCHENFIYLDVV